MSRRAFLATVCSAGVAATAGCSALAGTETLSDPTVARESAGEAALIFTSDGEEVGHFGADGRVRSGRIDVSTEIWHRAGTSVNAIELRTWMSESATAAPAAVAVGSPVEGDSSPPPSVTLATPESGPGTVIEITDLDDLADETISTLDLIVVPRSETATDLNVRVTIELTGGGVLDSDYALDGELQLAYPELADR